MGKRVASSSKVLNSRRARRGRKTRASGRASKGPSASRTIADVAQSDLARFKSLDYDGFRKLARDSNLDRWQKIGFPSAYRRGLEAAIFQDIRGKLRALDLKGRRILDIGAGCGDLPRLLAKRCRALGNELTLLDSAEMLRLIPASARCRKVVGRFPDRPKAFVAAEREGFDAILCYSVFQYVVNDASWTKFLDAALSLLRPGGDLLIGDVPNLSKRNRFFSSEAGIAFHQKFMKTDGRPDVRYGKLATGEIDDAIVLAVLQRCRAAGFDAYVVPQDERLPMANRREDILIRRP